MSCDGISRIKYYRGQLLTARDFQDQQRYHRQKHRNLLQRFPYGIIGGLEVTCAEKDDDIPNDYDGFLIQEGLAVDDQGNEIIVPEQGYKVPLTEFDPNKPYLSLRYVEEEDHVGNGACDTVAKNNRVLECFDHSWDTSPNISPSITVALISVIEENAGSCGDFDVQLEEEEGGPRIRINARLVDTDQIADAAIIESKIRTNAVTNMKISDAAISEAKLVDGAVSENKLNTNVQARLVTDGDLHNHIEGSGGARIPVDGLHSDVQGKLVTNGDSHNHTSGDGAKIPLEGLATDISGRLVEDGSSHDHTDDSGGNRIPETGLHNNVRGKLVTGGDSHDHTSGHGAKIPLEGLADEITNQFITDGNTHDHTGDSGGALIPETGLQTAVRNKLVTNGDSHDHTSGAGARIPESGLTPEVSSRLVTEGDDHDHTAGHGAPVPTAGIADRAVTSPKLNVSSSEYEQRGTVGVEGVVVAVRIQGPDFGNVWVPHVLPVSVGTRLQWSYDVEYEKKEVMTYHITILNRTDSAGEYLIRFVNLNT